MKKIITDSSVMVKWVSQTNETDVQKADQILQDVQQGKTIILAPELSKYEIGNALLKKGLTIAQAFQSLGTVASLPIHFISETEELATQTYQIAHEMRSQGYEKFTYYDAAFAALANQENATLVTDNPKHQAKIKNVKVLPLSKYK